MCRDESHDRLDLLNINVLVTTEAESRMAATRDWHVSGREYGEIDQAIMTFCGRKLFIPDDNCS